MGFPKSLQKAQPLEAAPFGAAAAALAAALFGAALALGFWDFSLALTSARPNSNLSLHKADSFSTCQEREINALLRFEPTLLTTYF